MADLARRATRWVGTLSDGNMHVKFHDDRLRNGGDITYWKFHGNTFRWPTTLTFDLKFWKYLSVTEYPYSICMLSFMMIGWEMTEILHFEILRKHGQTHKHTNTHTNKQTNKWKPLGERDYFAKLLVDTNADADRCWWMLMLMGTDGRWGLMDADDDRRWC